MTSLSIEQQIAALRSTIGLVAA